MPTKNRGYGGNNDLDDMWGEEDILAGDQGAPPMQGGGDEFGEEDILEGDQALNPNVDDGEESLMIEADFSDDENRKFINELKGNKNPASAKNNKATAQKSTTSKQSVQRENSWAGNGLGSGTMQQQNKKSDAGISRQTTEFAKPMS